MKCSELKIFFLGKRLSENIHVNLDLSIIFIEKILKEYTLAWIPHIRFDVNFKLHLIHQFYTDFDRSRLILKLISSFIQNGNITFALVIFDLLLLLGK